MPTSEFQSAPLVRRRRPRGPQSFRTRDGSIAIQGGPILTPRRAEVLECVAAGMTNREIAAEFGLSTETVKKHLQKLFATIGVRNRAALSAWWVEVSMDLVTHGAGRR